MFWKKKKLETDTINNESNDQRAAYRYEFSEEKQLHILFKNQKVQVMNISAGGMSIENINFHQFDVDKIQFTLDVPNYKGDTSFLADLRILKIDENQVCHCIFEQCSLEQHELIHKYVLEMQKDDLAH